MAALPLPNFSLLRRESHFEILVTRQPMTHPRRRDFRERADLYGGSRS